MSREFSGLFGVALVAWLGHAEVSAQETEAALFPVPDLVGTWTGTFKLMRVEGSAEGPLELRVLEQDGPLLKAEKAWELAPGSTSANVGGELVTMATEPLVGVIDFDGRSVQFAEQGDGGLYTGRLTGPDTLELVYIEAGDVATAYRMKMTRSE